MSFLVSARNALNLLFHGEWREFHFRLRVHLGQIDLETAQMEELQLPEDRSYHYMDSGGLHLERVLKTLEITAKDSIIDFGSGKGGALFTFSKYPFSRIVGCELSPELVAIAEKNLKAMKVKNVELLLMDAADLTELDDYNYFYFFNPFPCHVMTSVLVNMAASLERRPRKATLIYCNPECHDSVIANSSFNKVAEYTHYALMYFIYSNEMCGEDSGGVNAAEG